MQYDFKDIGGIPESDIMKTAEDLGEYAQELQGKIEAQSYAVPEAGLISIVDEKQVSEADRIAENMGSVRHVVLIGIGGSSAGVEAVYGALRSGGSPQLHVLDILASKRLERTLASLTGVSTEDIAVVIISKSGATTETIANADVCLHALRDIYGEKLSGRVIVIGDADTLLQAQAELMGFNVVAMPKEVGGRFSIFTLAGLVPLALLGIDIKGFVRGARVSLRFNLEEGEGTARTNAALLHMHAERGTRIHVLFAESERILGFARWWAQLLAESLGKEKDKDGDPYGGGLAPLVLSPRELHSTAQLYLSGFEGVFTTFIASAPEKSGFSIQEGGLGAVLSIEGDRSYARLAPAIMEGVHSAYANAKLPHAILDIGELSPKNMGALVSERMLEVMYVAHLGNINAFDQPHVELYKKEARRILGDTVE